MSGLSNMLQIVFHEIKALNSNQNAQKASKSCSQLLNESFQKQRMLRMLI